MTLRPSLALWTAPNTMRNELRLSRALHSGSRFSRIAAKNSSSMACSLGGTVGGNSSSLMRLLVRCMRVCQSLSFSQLKLPNGPSMRQSPL